MFVTVTVRPVRPAPVTLTAPVAVPVVFRTTSSALSVTAAASEYVTVKLTGPVAVADTDGGPMLMPGAVLSTTNACDGPNARATLPTASRAVPTAIRNASVPSPLRFVSATVRTSGAL